MLKQKLVGTVINGVGAPVGGTITATTFPNSVVGTDLIKKTVITATVGVDGKFVIYVPKFVECAIKITSDATTLYSTVINVTNDDELDLSVYAATPPPSVADPFTLHMQDTAIHNPALGAAFLAHCSVDAATGLPLWDGGPWPGSGGVTPEAGSWLFDDGTRIMFDDNTPVRL